MNKRYMFQAVAELRMGGPLVSHWRTYQEAYLQAEAYLDLPAARRVAVWCPDSSRWAVLREAFPTHAERLAEAERATGVE